MSTAAVTPDQFRAAIAAIAADAAARIAAAADPAALEAARIDLLGRKSGRFTELLRHLPALPIEARKELGAAANAAKTEIERALDAGASALAASAAPTTPRADLTLPARETWRGAKHPVTLVVEEIEQIFGELGFTVALGPEAETEWYNFQALNFPSDHPAMDAHDTLYLSDGVVLRTHTSPVQVRTLQRYGAPVRVLVPGNVYRRDFFDASHAPMFAQLEGLAVDEGISFVDLKATLSHFARRFFSRTTKTRFRPSYFPFTEPSAEMDVECQLCKGSGCAACKQTGWMEILGSGMVHPNVLDAAGVDSERYTGYAWGMGPGRIAMLRYGLPNIRLEYDSDVRFLSQFAE